MQYAKWRNEHQDAAVVPFFVIALVGDLMMIWGVVETVGRDREGVLRRQYVSDRFITADLSDPTCRQSICKVVAALQKACIVLADAALAGGLSNSHSEYPFLTSFSLEGGDIVYDRAVPYVTTIYPLKHYDYYIYVMCQL